MGEVPLNACVFVMAPATWRRRFEDRGEAMDPGMEMGSILSMMGLWRCGHFALARAGAWNCGLDWRRGSPGSFSVGLGACHNLALPQSLPESPRYIIC
jgi:hypothetical protein